MSKLFDSTHMGTVICCALVGIAVAVCVGHVLKINDTAQNATLCQRELVTSNGGQTVFKYPCLSGGARYQLFNDPDWDHPINQGK